MERTNLKDKKICANPLCHSILTSQGSYCPDCVAFIKAAQKEMNKEIREAKKAKETSLKGLLTAGKKWQVINADKITIGKFTEGKVYTSKHYCLTTVLPSDDNHNISTLWLEYNGFLAEVEE